MKMSKSSAAASSSVPSWAASLPSSFTTDDNSLRLSGSLPLSKSHVKRGDRFSFGLT